MNIRQQLFEQDLEKFARTIVIKHTDAANALNRALREQGYQVSREPRTWKYHLNLAGVYHPSQTKMRVVSLDTLEEIEFNTANLQIHLGTKREYYYGSIYYNELVARYPENELLIRGIIAPIPIERSVSANDGEILYYDQSLIEPQEINLIPGLQEWIYDTLKQSTVVGFKVTDDLYHLGIWANIYGHLASWIRTKRWENCHTIQAHSYHIWNYLESNGKLGQFRRYLTNQQAQWLYRNIRWIHANAGTKEAFVSLLDKILSERNIPLGEYDYSPDVSKIGNPQPSLSSGTTLAAQLTTSNLTPIPRLLRKPLNLFDVVSTTPVVKTVQYVSEEQLTVARDNRDFLLSNIKESQEALQASPLGNLPIKIYQSEMIDTSDQQYYNFGDLLLNHWLRLAHLNRYASVINIADPRTTELLSMNTKEAFLAFVYTWSKLNGTPLGKIPTFNAWMVRKVQTPSRKQLKRLFPKGAVPDQTLLALMEDQPPIGTVVSTEGFYTLVYEIWSRLIKHYKLVSYVEHYQTRAYVESVVLDFYEQAGCFLGDFEGQTFNEYFSARGWDLSGLNRTDTELINKDLWEKTTGIDTQNILRVKDIQNAMISLMRRLGTYSVQYLQSINDVPAIVFNWPAVRLGRIGQKQFAELQVHLGVGVTGLVNKQKLITPVQFQLPKITVSQKAKQLHKVTNFAKMSIDVKTTDRIEVQLGVGIPALLNEASFDRTVPDPQYWDQ